MNRKKLMAALASAGVHTADPNRYTNDDGKTLVTDGGAAAMAGMGGDGLGPGGTDPAGSLAVESGDGFDQFVALATKDTTAEGHPLHANAARQAAEFRANSRLRKDEWISLDERLVPIAQDELNLVDALRARNLTVDEDLATLIREFETTNDFGDADVDMSGESGASEDASTFTLNGVPLPIVHKSFHVKRRQLLASRRRGQGLDLANQGKAARSVMEGLEDLVLDGWGSTVQGYQAYGLRTHPDRNQPSGTDWSAAGDPEGQARQDILAAVEAVENDNYDAGGTGYVFALNKTQWQELRRFDTGTDRERSAWERLREEFGDLLDFVKVPRLPAGEAILFKPVSDVVELANASDIQNVEWESASGWTLHMKVMASMTPIVKSDDSNQSGIAHLTGI